MINKRGQAAMEFLMTYGWALLVVLVAIGALAFFGVLNPGQFLPSTCTITPGLACNDFQYLGAGTGSANLVIQNGFGDGMYDITVSLSADGGTTLDCSAGGGTATQSDGAEATYTLTACGAESPGAKVKRAVVVSYKLGSTTGLAHTKIGQMVTQSE